MAETYTDERLIEMELPKSGPGFNHAAEYLRKITGDDRVALRDAIVTEATIMGNMSAGWVWSHAIDHVVNEYLRTGQVPQSYTNTNRSILEKERLARGY